jgi:hypothetical protein
MTRATTVFVSTVGILLLAGCGNSLDTDPDPATLSALVSNASSISGNLVGPDSLPVSRGNVHVYLAGPVPPDTIPPDSTPPDTTALSSAAYGAAPVALRSDSVPGDSTPPPPPPPPSHCGERGTLVARTQSNEAGFFRVNGLAPGIYDIRARAGGSRGSLCGVILRDSQQVFVTIMLSAGGTLP